MISLPLPEQLGISERCQGPVMLNFLIASIGVMVLTATAHALKQRLETTLWVLGGSIAVSIISILIMTYAMGFLCLKKFKKSTVLVMIVNILVYVSATAGLVKYL